MQEPTYVASDGDDATVAKAVKKTNEAIDSGQSLRVHRGPNGQIVGIDYGWATPSPRARPSPTRPAQRLAWSG